jgi:hypothetical protein
MLENNVLIVKLVLKIDKVALNLIVLLTNSPKLTTTPAIGLHKMHRAGIKRAPILIPIDPYPLAPHQKLIKDSLINIIICPQPSLTFPSIILEATLINLMCIDLSAVLVF